MKTLKILVSSNAWEYSKLVTFVYKNNFTTFRTSIYAKDSEGNFAPNGIILDDTYKIEFDEGFEILDEE
jgi:hypothetical protein